ncbi:hypothetical protein Vafri_12082, partial [Volvox africanus]
PMLQPQHLERVRHNQALHFVVRVRDTLKCLEALQGSRTSGSLVWDHAAHSPPEDAGRRTEVEWATGWVGVHPLAQEPVILHLLPHKAARDSNLLGPDHDNLLPTQNLLGHHRGQAAQHVGPPVDDHRLRHRSS